MIYDHEKDVMVEMLNTLGLTFRDPLSDGQLAVYCEAIASRATIEELHYACDKATATTMFHKIPVPAVLLGYCYEYRTQADDAAKRRVQSVRAQKLLAMAHEAHQGTLTPGNSWARGHLELFERGLGVVGNELEAAAFCQAKAEEETGDSAEWSLEAVVYRRLADHPNKRDPETMRELYAALRGRK